MKFSSKLECEGEDLILVLPNDLVKVMGIEEGDDMVPVEIGPGLAIFRHEKAKI